MRPLTEALIEALIAFTRAGLTVRALEFKESNYLALALELGLHDPSADRRYVRPLQYNYRGAEKAICVERFRIDTVQVHDSFEFAGPSGMVTIKAAR